MIITADSQQKGPEPGDYPYTGDIDAPPAYGANDETRPLLSGPSTSQSAAGSQQGHHSPSYASTSTTSSDSSDSAIWRRRKKERKRKGKRFIRTCLFVVFFCVVLGVVIASWVHFGDSGRQSGHHPSKPSEPKPSEPSAPKEPELPDDYDKLPGYSLQKCSNDWKSQYPFSHSISARDEESDSQILDSTWTRPPMTAATISFELPMTSDLLFFLSRGSFQKGAVRFTSSPDLEDTAKIVVIGRAFRDEFLEKAQVCVLKKEWNENGIGVFTPKEFWGKNRYTDYVQADIEVTLPQDTSRAIKAIKLDFSNYAFVFQNLDHLRFDSFDARTKNSAIRVSALSVEKGILRTTNGAIDGFVKAQQYLELQTTDSPINANVELSSVASYVNSTLVMRTSNGGIHSTVSLVSSLKQDAHFEVDAETTNEAIDLKFDSQPIDSILHVTAATTNGPSYIALAKPYEGSFDLSTSSQNAKVHEPEKGNEKDPSGKGRPRIVNRERVTDVSVVGWASWGPQKDAQGSVKMTTTNGPVVLTI